MGKLNGNALIVIIGSVTVAPGDLIGVSWNVTGSKAESTGIADTWDTFVSEMAKGVTLTINGYWRGGGAREASTFRKAVFDAWEATGHSATFSIRPSGTGSGLRTVTGTLIVDSAPFAMGISGPNTLSLEATVNGALGDAGQ